MKKKTHSNSYFDGVTLDEIKLCILEEKKNHQTITIEMCRKKSLSQLRLNFPNFGFSHKNRSKCAFLALFLQFYSDYDYVLSSNTI